MLLLIKFVVKMHTLLKHKNKTFSQTAVTLVGQGIGEGKNKQTKKKTTSLNN